MKRFDGGCCWLMSRASASDARSCGRRLATVLVVRSAISESVTILSMLIASGPATPTSRICGLSVLS